MIQTFISDGRLRQVLSLVAAGVASFAAPVVPYAALCTAMVLADFVSARLLARRVRRRLSRRPQPEATRFSSRRFGNVIATVAKIYAFLLLSRGVDAIIIGDGAQVSMLRAAAAMVCFWQLWSVLENEASANNARWARVAQRILVDKTERHLGVTLADVLEQPDTKDEKTDSAADE